MIPEIKWGDVKLRIGGEEVKIPSAISLGNQIHTYDQNAFREVEVTDASHNNLTVVNYSKSRWSKGDAWRHLLNNPPPSVEISHIGPPSVTNPWRKNHGGVYWSWSAKTTKAKEEVDTMSSNKLMKDLIVGDKFRDKNGYVREIVSKQPYGCGFVQMYNPDGLNDDDVYELPANYDIIRWGTQIAFGGVASELKVGDRFKNRLEVIRKIVGLSGSSTARIWYSDSNIEVSYDLTYVINCIRSGFWGVKMPPEEKNVLNVTSGTNPILIHPPAKPELKPTATYTFYDDEADIDRIFKENPQSQVVKVNGEIWIRKGRVEFVCRKFGCKGDGNTDPRIKDGHKQVILAHTTFEELIEALRKREHFKVEVY